MKFVCKFVQNEFEEKKANNKKMWEIVREFNPDTKIEDFYSKCGICGNPDTYFLQEVLKNFRDDGKRGFTFHPFLNKTGQASNGMLSSEQLYMMAAEVTGQHADKDNVSLFEDGATTIMQINGGAIFIMVQTYLEDGEISGVATILQN
jgi:hypothetical protein